MAKDRKIIEAKIDEVLSANNKKAAASKAKSASSTADPFAGGMPNMADNNPFAAFGAGAMPGGAKLPLKMRIMAKLASLATNPKFTRFLQKKWWPLWIIVGILLSGFILIAAILFLIWKGIKAIINAYTGMFRK